MKWRPNGTQWVNSEREIYPQKNVLDLHHWDHSRLQHLLREQKPEFLQRPHTKRTENGPENYKTIRKSISNPVSNPVFLLSLAPPQPICLCIPSSPEPGRIQKPVDARAGVSKVGKNRVITKANYNVFSELFWSLDDSTVWKRNHWCYLCKYIM